MRQHSLMSIITCDVYRATGIKSRWDLQSALWFDIGNSTSYISSCTNIKLFFCEGWPLGIAE